MNLQEQLKQQIEQEAKSNAANFNYYPESEECEDLESSYITGATKYATRAITAEAENERLRKALEEILNTNHDNHEKVIVKVKSIATEALTQKPTTNE